MNDKCPNCGYCSHCGRTSSPYYQNPFQQPFSPQYPIYWGTYPYQVTCQNGTLGQISTTGYLSTSANGENK